MKIISPKIAVVGAGHLGFYHIKHLANNKNCTFVGFYDPDKKRSKEVSLELSVKSYDSLKNLLEDCDAVHIASTTSSHYRVASDCLRQNKHVFIEKPICSTTDEAQDLIDLAKKKNLIIQVGHIERFNPTIVLLKSMISEPSLIEFERLHEYNIRGTDVPVILDLMVHDIDLCSYFFENDSVVSISSLGSKVMSNTVDVATAQIKFKSGKSASIKTSRVAQNNVRKLRTYSDQLYSVTDLILKQVEIYSFIKKPFFTPSMISRKIDTPKGKREIFYEKFLPDNQDALLNQINSFISCIKLGTVPIVDGLQGLGVLKTAKEIESQILQKNE